jgi:sugar lactone lactonase YvrE
MTKKLLVLLLTVTSAIATAAVAAPFPDRIELPNGWQPEGIAAGGGHSLFVGSIPTGAVTRLDARTGEGHVVVPGGEGRAAIGLKADRRGRLFVAGGPTGKAFVYDSHDGAELEQFQLAPGTPTFVNDVALTRRAAYFTDSRRASLYVVDTDLSAARELPLNGIDLAEGNNLNGIVAAKRRKLLAVQGNVGKLWRIDARTGDARQVDLGGAELTNGDGLLLHGRTLYAVQNRLNKIAVVRLNRRLTAGRVVREITSADFSVPTTIARRGDSLYAVNARFGTPPTPDTPYWVTRVPRR